jgi:hypothetical protein
VAISDGPLTRPLMNLHSAIPVLTVMNFHHGLLADGAGSLSAASSTVDTDTPRLIYAREPC